MPFIGNVVLSLKIKTQLVPSRSICQCDINVFHMGMESCIAATVVICSYKAHEDLPSLGQPDSVCAVTVNSTRHW